MFILSSIKPLGSIYICSATATARSAGVKSVRLFLQPRHRPHLARRRALEYGIVGINEGIIWIEIAPFGGMKEYGIEEFLEVKCLCMGGIDR